jgi:nucleoside 2-deoxyribosyltransferase
MIYLASPYSHVDAVVREQRFRAACQATARLIAAGHIVFSPIVHGHPLVHHGLPTDWPFWERFDRDHLVRCDEAVVLMLDGWQESVGVAAEIRIAAELGKPVRYLAPDARVVPPTSAHVAEEAGR